MDSNTEDTISKEDDQFQNILEELYDELIDEVSLGVCFEIHRAAKRGYIFIGCSDKNDKPRVVVNRPGVDVFGYVPTKKQVDCVCPNCSRNMAAQRFAPHLEKCMGMGRNSSRIASRRIANSQPFSGKRDSDESDDGNDSDWSSNADKRVKKLKKDKHSNSPRRVKSRHRNGESDVAISGETAYAYDSMSLDEKKSLLVTMCGAISDHTHKMCTKSIKCPQHSDEQRRAVREQMIGPISGTENEDQPVDIDTYDDVDSQSLRYNIQWESSSNPSPTDYSSNVISSQIRKRPSKSLLVTSKKPKLLYETKPPSTQSTTPTEYDLI